MILPGLSLSALPAITSVASQALRTGAQAGGHFLSLLSKESDATTATAAGSPASDSLSQRTQSFSQRFMSWLRTTAPEIDKQSLQLSLDSRDQPQVLVNGQPSTAVDQALSKDPTWMQEFRELALDRIEGLAGLASSAATRMTLTIRPQSDTMLPEATTTVATWAA